MESALSTETGRLGIMHLKRYWSKTMMKKKGIPVHDDNEWELDRTLLNAAGVGIHPTLKFLHKEMPSFAAFENWIEQSSSSAIDKQRIESFNSIFSDGYVPLLAEKDETIFSASDRSFWEEHGYFIIKNAVSKEDCTAAVSAIETFLGIDMDDPATWYSPHPEKNGIMVEFFKHPVLQSNRDNEKIRAVYEQLWGRKDIWATTDRVSFNPPETTSYKFPGPRLHWDVSMQLPIPFGLQGILYLSDTTADQGAFTLVPGFQNRIESWLGSLPGGTNARTQDMYALGTKAIEANAGDFIVWHHALPHGSSPNTSTMPRIVQYINFSPPDAPYHSTWI